MNKNYNSNDKIKEFSDNILKYISQKINNISTITEAVESINLIYEILINNNEEEEFKRIKNEILLGIPILNIDENKFNNKFYSIIDNEKESILQKISVLFTSNKDFVGVAKCFLNLILNSENVFEYLIQLPSLHNFNNNFIQFFIERCENLIEKTKLLKEKKEDENVIIAKEDIELIQKIKEKYNLNNEKIKEKKMFVISENISLIINENQNLKVFKSIIEYITEEIDEKINLNDIDYYSKNINEKKMK
jgi:hypothetical protein